jgi:hypothetical protein
LIFISEIFYNNSDKPFFFSLPDEEANTSVS